MESASFLFLILRSWSVVVYLAHSQAASHGGTSSVGYMECLTSTGPTTILFLPSYNGLPDRVNKVAPGGNLFSYTSDLSSCEKMVLEACTALHTLNVGKIQSLLSSFGPQKDLWHLARILSLSSPSVAGKLSDPQWALRVFLVQQPQMMPSECSQDNRPERLPSDSTLPGSQTMSQDGMVRVVLATPHTYQEQTIYMNPTILHDRGGGQFVSYIFCLYPSFIH